MGDFLGRAAFPGPCLDVAAAGVGFVGQACFNGCITVCNSPRREVEAVLPPELELAPATSAGADHPVAFVFGEQTAGAVLVAGIAVPMGVRYHEFAMTIPFVKHRRGRYLHNYIPRMYSGYFPATWHGNAFYGFAKEMATMSWQGPVFLVAAEDGALLLHAVVDATADWLPATPSTLPSFEAMRAIFALPVLGRKADGRFVCSYFGWGFDGAAVRAADVSVTIDASLVAGVTPRVYADVPGGSFEVRGMVWRLSWPTACRF